jgi:CRP-like cAMP-binding protein
MNIEPPGLMPFQKILKNVGKHIRLSEKEVNYFISLLKVKAVARHSLILEEGQLCRSINYINHGAFRSFCTDKKGTERIVMFAIDDWWITDMQSFVLEGPAIVAIEAIEAGEILQLQKDDLERLYAKVPAFEKFFRVMMQNAYIREQLRVTRTLTEDADQRYRDFLTKYPLFVERIPLKYIASYLGVTPQFLSVLRKRKVY